MHRVLIDGGPAPTYEAGLRRRIADLPEDKRTFELMVVTHIDADHIDGSLILLQELVPLKIRRPLGSPHLPNLAALTAPDFWEVHMMRKVFLPFFLAVMLLPAIVLAHTKLPSKK